MMNNYQGDEQNNPILQYIRSKDLYLEHTDNAYQLWNAAKQGVQIGGLTNDDAIKWFGHCLFTTNVRACVADSAMREIGRLFWADPQRPVVPMSLGSASYSYESAASSHVIPESYDPEELQIARYSSLGSFFWNLSSALDITSIAIAYLYDLQQLYNQHNSRLRLDPLKTDFGKVIKFIGGLSRTSAAENRAALDGLTTLMTQEGLVGNDFTCDWYERLKTQRNYYTHIAFPQLFVQNGGWFLSARPRSTSPSTNLTPNVPDLCADLNHNGRRVISAVFACMWDDFGQQLA